MKKKDIELTLSYFKEHLNEIESKLNKRIYKEIEKVVNDVSNRGILNSGMTAGGMVCIW